MSYLVDGAHLYLDKRELRIVYQARGPLARLGLGHARPAELRIARDGIEAALVDEPQLRVVVQIVGPTGRPSLVGMQFERPEAVARLRRYLERACSQRTHVGTVERRRASRLFRAYLIAFALLGVIALAVAIAAR
ncbi:MAG: hypothetical protein IT373_31800 [Polyangiaceae bacterium]|nr:hypothetical protein [Polyangiaceae bacterium]